MLFRASALACALAVSLVHGSCIAPGPYVSSPSAPPAPVPASGGAPITEGYTSTKTLVVSNFQTCETRVVKYGPIFKDACKRNQVQDVISGLVDIRVSLLTLIAHINVGVGTWLAVDLNIFANLYVTLLAKIQVLLSIIRTNGQLDPYRSSIIDLTVPLKAVIAIFVHVGINISALISAKVNLNVFVSVGISLGISVNVGVGLGLGVNVDAGVGVGL